jgi:hypothetical protein
MSSRNPLPAAWILAVVPLALALPAAIGCSRGPQISPAEVVAVHRDTLPADPADPAWRGAPFHPAALILQDMVEPRLLEPSTPRVEVQAMTDGRRVAFRLVWPDASRDDLPGTARFSDAVAVQLPVSTGPDVPAPQMGELGRRVEITYWRASWQAMVDGREDSIRALYPNASVDHYPFEAPSLPEGSDARREMEARYAPARALGNPMEGPRDRPVEDLLAEGPGSLGPAPSQCSEGTGSRTAQGWQVVVSRPLPEGLAGGGRTQVAFAVWQGALDEVGARKMRSPWIPLRVEGRP